MENRFIENIAGFNRAYLSTYSADVLEKIHAGSDDLARLVPPPVFEVIKSRQLFGWGGK